MGDAVNLSIGEKFIEEPPNVGSFSFKNALLDGRHLYGITAYRFNVAKGEFGPFQVKLVRLAMDQMRMIRIGDNDDGLSIRAQVSSKAR